MFNFIEGAKHADNNLAIQEFLVITEDETFRERVRHASELFHNLKKILAALGNATGVGDEGGFAPNLSGNEEAIRFIIKAIKESGYVPGKDVYIAIDCAASEFYDKQTGLYHIDNKNLDADGLMKYYMDLVSKYPIISIEDPFMEDDFDSLAVLTKIVENKLMLVGDDYFVTNKRYLQKGINLQAGNAILLKANQIGTVTEMIETILLARKANYKMVISHRSGETEDTFIADLAVGLCIPYIKTGSLSRGERIAKYNRLLRIEEMLMKR
jgi:enolase